MRFILFFARRYIFASHSFNIINIVSIISIVGISVGVAALICVMSIFNGFSDIAKEQIIGLDPHLRIIPESTLSDEEQLNIINQIINIKGVVSCIPVVYSKTVIFKGENMQVLQLYAVPSNQIATISGIKNNIILGDIKFDSLNFTNELIIGAAIGDRLRVFPGDTVYLMTPEMIETSLRTYRRPSPLESVIRGIYLSNHNYDFYGFADIGKINNLFASKKNLEFAIDVRVVDIDNLESIKATIQNMLPQSYRIETWKDLNRDIYRIMDFEKMVAFSILSLIILIAVFNIFALLNMTVAEKRSDISALKAIGANEKLITRLFIAVGSMIGSIGTIIGVLLGLGLCYGQLQYGWFKLDTSKYFVSQLPLSINYFNVVLICIVSLLLSLLATIYPSRRAGKTDLLKALREE